MTKRDLFLFLFKWQRLIICVTMFIIALSSVLTYVQPQSFHASSMLLVEGNRAPAMRSAFAPGVDSAEVQNTVSSIITTRAVMTAVVDELKPHLRKGKPSAVGEFIKSVKTNLQDWGLMNRVEPREKWIARLLRQVKTTIETGSNIIMVRFGHEDPVLAQTIVNAVTDHFLELHLKIYSPSGADSFKNQHLSLKKQLDEKINALEAYKASTQASALEHRRPELVRLLGNLQEWHASSSAQAAELSHRYERGHTELVALQARIAQYEKSIQATKDELRQLELQTSQLRKLQLEVDSSEELYKQYKRRFEESRLDKESMNRDTINVRVVEYADIPVKPNHSRLFYILIATVAGCFFSIGLALLFEHFDRRVSDPIEAEMIFQLPVLASLEKV